jgi:hypothetical protein
MTTAQTEFTAEELLLSHDYAEPLIANGVRCHGGFDDEGRYLSPRTRFRGPAIEAWEQQRVEQFSTPILDIPLESWPETFPNVEQTKFLMRHGVTEPTISTLTRIGTVEGFGGMLRLIPLPDFRSLFVEDIQGTAVDHIARGLFEAHARDEAGHEAEAGHNVMWFVARDIAFDNPVTEDQTALMLERMGITPPGSAPSQGAPKRSLLDVDRVLPDDIDPMVEFLLARMIGLLFIEISAFHGFRWAEAVLSDTDLVAGDGEPARLVSYIRADETPHVAYLRTALSEMRDRTWIGSSGARYDGAEMIGLAWDRAVEESMLTRRAEALKVAMSEMRHAMRDRSDAEDLIDEMLTLGDVRRLADGTLVDATDPRYEDAA